MMEILTTGIVVAITAFAAEIFADRRIPALRRAVVAICFGIAGFVLGVGTWACYLFHDGILPDDNRLSGLPAVWSFLRAFSFPTATASILFVGLGAALRRWPRRTSELCGKDDAAIGEQSTAPLPSAPAGPSEGAR
jgi:hypothetical protein